MKKIFSKEKFNTILDNLRLEYDMIHELYNKFGINIDLECHWFSSDYQLVELLKYIFNDEDTDYIGWWIYEADFGRDSSIAKVYIDENGEEKEIPLSNSSMLYDFLIDNEEEREKWLN